MLFDAQKYHHHCVLSHRQKLSNSFYLLVMHKPICSYSNATDTDLHITHIKFQFANLLYKFSESAKYKFEIVCVCEC